MDDAIRLAKLEEKVEALREKQDYISVTQEKDVDKATAVLNARLETMNEFRAQLSSQAALFVTRDNLDLRIKEVNVRLESLQSRLDVTKGRDSTIYAFLAMAVAAISVVIAWLKP